MRFFKTKSGVYINPKLVTYCCTGRQENGEFVLFKFDKDELKIVIIDRQYSAEAELECFIDFCKQSLYNT